LHDASKNIVLFTARSVWRQGAALFTLWQSQRMRATMIFPQRSWTQREISKSTHFYSVDTVCGIAPIF